MSTQQLSISPRSLEMSKRQLHNARFKEGRLPASLYGKSLGKSLPIFVETKKGNHSGLTQGNMFKMKWDGKPVMATLKQIQRDPVSQDILHLSLHAVKTDEVVSVDLPLNFVGQASGDKDGGIIFTQRDRVSVCALPMKLPESIDVDISKLKIGESILLSEIKLPKSVELNEQDLDQPIIMCKPPKREEELASDLESSPEQSPEVTEQSTEEES